MVAEQEGSTFSFHSPFVQACWQSYILFRPDGEVRVDGATVIIQRREMYKSRPSGKGKIKSRCVSAWFHLRMPLPTIRISLHEQKDRYLCRCLLVTSRAKSAIRVFGRVGCPPRALSFSRSQPCLHRSVFLAASRLSCAPVLEVVVVVNAAFF